MSEMIKHIVFWNYNDEARKAGTEKVTQELSAKFASLQGKIDGLLHIELGVNYKEGGHNAALYCEFESREAEAAYQVNPLHVVIAQYVHQYFQERTCIDYEL